MLKSRKLETKGRRIGLPLYELLFRILFCTGMLVRVTYLSVDKYHHWAAALQTLLARMY